MHVAYSIIQLHTSVLPVSKELIWNDFSFFYMKKIHNKHAPWPAQNRLVKKRVYL